METTIVSNRSAKKTGRAEKITRRPINRLADDVVAAQDEIDRADLERRLPTPR